MATSLRREIARLVRAVVLATVALLSRPAGLRLGAQVRARAERPVVPVWFAPTRATMIVEVGVKSQGFVPGEPLGSGVNVRAVVGLPR